MSNVPKWSWSPQNVSWSNNSQNSITRDSVSDTLLQGKPLHGCNNWNKQQRTRLKNGRGENCESRVCLNTSYKVRSDLKPLLCLRSAWTTARSWCVTAAACGTGSAGTFSNTAGASEPAQRLKRRSRWVAGGCVRVQTTSRQSNLGCLFLCVNLQGEKKTL